MSQVNEVSINAMSESLITAQVVTLVMPSILSTPNRVLSTSVETAVSEHENLSTRERKDNSID